MRAGDGNGSMAVKTASIVNDERVAGEHFLYAALTQG